jgi:hypothetical protein
VVAHACGGVGFSRRGREEPTGIFVNFALRIAAFHASRKKHFLPGRRAFYRQKKPQKSPNFALFRENVSNISLLTDILL